MSWMLLFLIFFFSSRRRHTRLTCDWSSDVCSSDLNSIGFPACMTLREIRSNCGNLQSQPLHASLPNGPGLFLDFSWVKIGRASCRERVYMTMEKGLLKRNRKSEIGFQD